MIGVSIFIVSGAIIIFWGLYLFYKGKKTKSWKINTAEIKEVNLGINNDFHEGSNVYQCIVKYEYKPLGSNQIVTGKKIAEGYLPSNNKKGHLEILKKLKSAKTIRIWENALNNNETCISKGVNGNSYFLMTFGLMIILFSLSIFSLANNKPYPHDKIFKVEVLEVNVK